MTGEGGERGRRRREGHDESDDDIERMMKDITDEIEKELEREQKEGQEPTEDQELAMRKAIEDLEREDEERQRANEEYMGKIQEKEDERERARQEREESAEKDSLDDFEQKELERMKKKGEDPEDVLNRWREQYVKEVEDYIGDTPDAKEVDDDKEDVGSAPEKPADDLSYFGDGSGQMYATKSEHKEETGGELESESEKDAASKELEKEREHTNPSENDSKPAEGERTKSDAEGIDSEPRPSPEASKPGEVDESSMEKSTHREAVAKGESRREAAEEDEPERLEKDEKKNLEEWSRKYRERFHELEEEEEKDEFRDFLVNRAKNMKDVEKLARRNDYESLLEDEDAMKEIEEYFRTREALENAEDDEIQEIAEELGVDSKSLEEWDLIDSMPESLKELLNREGDFLWREVDRRFIMSFFPESSEELHSTEELEKLTYLCEDDEKLKDEAEAWIEIMARRNREELYFKVKDGREWYDSEQIEELSEEFGIPKETIAKWLQFEEIPSLIGELGVKRIEEAYTLTETPPMEIRTKADLHSALDFHWKLTLTKDFEQRLRQATFFCELMEKLDRGEMKPSTSSFRDFAKTHGVHRTTASRWANGLKRPSLIRDLERLSLKSSRTRAFVFSIEGIYRELRAEKDSLVNAYEDQYFYFSSEFALMNFIESAARKLGEKSMTKAIPNLFKISQKLGLETSHLTEKTHRIHGKSLSHLLEISGLPSSALEGKVVRITGANGHGGIKNPKFPAGLKLEVLKAKLIGIAVSDCHIPPSGSLHLCEGSLRRIERVKEILDSFGEAYTKTSVRERIGDFEFYIASPLTKALQYWGIPAGDRTIQNYGLPADFIDWSRESYRRYMQEMLAQEGSVDKNGVINWGRSHALSDDKKGTKYRFSSRISKEAKRFLMKSKHMKRHRGIVDESSISVGALRKLRRSSDATVSKIASEILSAIRSYRNKLIDNEADITRSLGIDVSLKPVRVSYFKKSKRITVRWQARITGYESKIRSALLVPPNHEDKHRQILNWLHRQSKKDIAEAKQQLKLEGFELDE